MKNRLGGGLCCLPIALLLLYADPVFAASDWKGVAKQQADVIQRQQAEIDALSKRLTSLESRSTSSSEASGPTVSTTITAPTSLATRDVTGTPKTSPPPSATGQPQREVSTAPISSVLAALPANGTVIPSRGFMNVPGTKAMLRIGGRVQVDNLYFPGAAAGESEDVVNPRGLNPSGPHHDRVRMTARDSCFLTDLRIPAGPLGGVRAYTEWDFLGTVPTNAQAQLNSYAPRLRHLFMEVGPGVGHWSFLAGQTWSAFNDVSSYADIYNGLLYGAVFTRQPQLRVTKWFGRKWSLAVSVENPSGEVAGATGAEANEQFDGMPDLVVTTRTAQRWGTLQAGMLLRRIDETSPPGSRFAWGVNLSGNLRIPGWGKDNVRFQTNYGTGIGRYIGELGPGFDGMIRPTHDGFDLINTFAANASFEHYWARRFYSTIAVSEISLNNPGEAVATSLKRTRTLTGTVVFTPADSLEFGLEATLAERKDEDGTVVSRPISRFTTRFTF